MNHRLMILDGGHLICVVPITLADAAQYTTRYIVNASALRHAMTTTIPTEADHEAYQAAVDKHEPPTP